MKPFPVVCRRVAAPVLLLAALLLASGDAAAQKAPSGRAVMAWHVTISPSWFDPSTAPPQITPFGMLYAIHDALVRPYPGHKMGPSLAESWQESEDGMTYEFKLRAGPEVPQRRPADHRGRQVQLRALQGRGGDDPAGARQAGRDRRSAASCASISRQPWPDFMTFYGTHRQRRRHRRAEEIPDRRSATTASRSTRSAPAPTSSSAQAGHRGRARGLSPATGAACRTSRRW